MTSRERGIFKPVPLPKTGFDAHAVLEEADKLRPQAHTVLGSTKFKDNKDKSDLLGSVKGSMMSSARHQSPEPTRGSVDGDETKGKFKLPKLVNTERKWASTTRNTGVATINPKDRYIAVNPLKWNPNDFVPDIIFNTTALNDKTHTPRGAKRAISLGRTFDKDTWVPTKKYPDDLCGFPIAKDQKKGKQIAKMMKKKRRASETT